MSQPDNLPHGATSSFGCVQLCHVSKGHGEPAKGFPRYAWFPRSGGLPAAGAGRAA